MATQVDMNLYDRQVRTFGQEASKKLVNSTVYIYNLAGGLGGEIAKNLALSGIKNIFLVDSDNINKDDVEFSYYYTDKNIGQARCDTLAPYIQELNPYTQVIPIKHTATFWDNIPENTCVVAINTTLDETIKYNELCHGRNIKMVYLRSSGLGGFIFVDALENHQVYDLSGENIEPVQVKSITWDGKIKCEEHNFQDGDTIVFTNLQGSNVDFFESEWIIKNTTKYSFEIVSPDTKEFPQQEFTFVNGTAMIIRTPTVFNHQTLKEQINSNKTIIGFEPELSENIINAFQLLDNINYTELHPWDTKVDLSKFDKSIHPLVRSYGTEIGPINSIMGGFTSSEVIKLVTNKYTPITQWFTWNDFSLLQKYEPLSLSGSKLEQLFGSAFVNRLKDLNVFMVGCGALGCEWLKNLALLNVATNNGVIDITDPDHIEKSNLSRQFLFRSEDIKQSKSKVAVDAIKKVNSSINMNAYLDKVSNDNNEFIERILRNKDVVISALDNIQARRYIDGQIFSKNLPLFESGTMGMKGNTQPVIPFITETYSNSSDPEAEKQFAVCTIKNFPNQIQHTIHWARDYFELFNRAPQNVNKFILEGSPDYLENLTESEKNQSIEDINMFLGKYNPIMFEECLIWASDIFEQEFNHSIQQLLHCFPKDHMVDGNLFWSQGKRCPTPLTYNSKIDCVVDFIEATTHLLCRCFNLEDNFTRDDIITWIDSYKIKDFTPDNNVTIAKVDSEIKETTKSVKLFECEDFNINYESQCIPQEFEKDDDSNWHVAWLTAASNCRATVYDIPTASQYETKGIAGRIIPAVATTTATVVGFISLEMMKYVANQENKDIDYQYRSWFVNMADNTSIGAEPIKAKELKYGNVTVNGWTKINYTYNRTLQGFIDYFQDFFKVEISMILHKSTIIFASFMSGPDKLNKPLLELFKENYQIDLTQEKLYLTIATDDEDIVLPEIILDLSEVESESHLNA